MVLCITQKCGGRNCIYCYAQDESSCHLGEMEFKHIAKIIEQAKTNKVVVITLSGGDPFVHKNIIDIIQMIVEAKIDLQLSTKQFLTDNTISRLKNIGLRSIQISIDAFENELAKIMTGVSMYAAKAFDTIKRLQKNEIEVSTNTIVTCLNAENVPELVCELYNIGVKVMRLSRYFRSAYKHSDELFLLESQETKLREFVDNFVSKHPDIYLHLSGTGESIENSKSKTKEEEIKRFANRGACSAGRTGMVILPNCKVIPCEQLPCEDEYVLGDTSRQTLSEIWNSQRFKGFFAPDRSLFQGTICYDCEHYDLCVIKNGWCSRDAWKAFGTIYQTNPICPKADPVA